MVNLWTEKHTLTILSPGHGFTFSSEPLHGAVDANMEAHLIQNNTHNLANLQSLYGKISRPVSGIFKPKLRIQF